MKTIKGGRLVRRLFPHRGFYLNCGTYQEMIGQSVIADELKKLK